RIWRISSTVPHAREATYLSRMGAKTSVGDLKTFLRSKRLDVRRLAARTLSQTQAGREDLLEGLSTSPERSVVESLYALATVPLKAESALTFKVGGDDWMSLKSSAACVVYLSLLAGDVPHRSFS